MPKRVERCWIVLADDGRHVTVGRAIDPNEKEILATAVALTTQGLGGWLAIMDGDYHRTESPISLLEVRRLGQPKAEWLEAESRFRQTRLTTLGLVSHGAQNLP